MCTKWKNKNKLLVTIVKKGMASKVVKASKEAGAEGGTIIMGRGTGIHEINKLFGIPVDPEKEVIFTLISEEGLEKVLNGVTAVSRLDRPGYGIAFVLDVSKIIGCVHKKKEEEALTPDDVRRVSMHSEINYDLIVTIVNKGKSEKVVEASRKAGAEGGTILFGRGTGIHEKARLFGITIEPEKEVILTLINREITDQVVEAITRGVELNKPGKGIAFVLEVERIAGICHVLNKVVSEKIDQLNGPD